MLDQRLERVAHKIDSQAQLLRACELKGGVSAQVSALELQHADGRLSKMVVRRHGDADLRQNPRVATDEFRLLAELHAAGLATPAPYLLDDSGEIFPTPYIVVEYIEGAPEFAPAALPDFLLQLATHLVQIHQVDCSQHGLTFLPRQEALSISKLSQRPAILDDSLDEGRIRDVLEASWPLLARNESVLLHGDYWPGNILWKDGRLIGIIDWEDAMVGDPLADIGNTRLELLWAFGSAAMHQFTAYYLSRSAVDTAHLPYWDLYAALRPAFKVGEWAADGEAERRMRARHKMFITQAFEKLSA